MSSQVNSRGFTMPLADARPKSLAGVIEAIAARQDLAPQTRSELASAVRTFCRCVGRDPSEVHANPVAIRALTRYAKRKLAGVSEGHFKNTTSRLTRAMAEVGIPMDRRRNMPLDPAWTALLAALPEKKRIDLRKFAGWCSARGTARAAVGQQTFADYFEFLAAQSIQHNPKERWRRAWRVWNKEVAVEGSPYPRIASIFADKARLISLADLPPQFARDLKAYQEALTRPALLGSPAGATTEPGSFAKRLAQGHRKALRPATAEGYGRNLVLLAGYLVRDGVAPDYFSSLDKLVDPGLLWRGLERIQRDVLAARERRRLGPIDPLTAPPSGNPDEAVPMVTAVAYSVLSLAKHVEAEAAILERIDEIAAWTRVPRRGMTAKNKARLGQFADNRALQLLLDLARQVMARYDGVEKATFKQAREVQNAAILAVLIEQPMRVGNVADLDLIRHFQRPAGGGKWLVSIAAHEVKNDETIDGEFTPETSALLNRYVAVFRPVLGDELTSALFPSRTGRAKRPTTVSTQFAEFIRRETGLVMNAHLMRAFATGICIEANPGDFETARQLLGHKSVDTTRKFYAHLDQRQAYGRYHRVLEAIRAAPATSGRTAFDFGRRRGGGAEPRRVRRQPDLRLAEVRGLAGYRPRPYAGRPGAEGVPAAGRPRVGLAARDARGGILSLRRVPVVAARARAALAGWPADYPRQTGVGRGLRGGIRHRPREHLARRYRSRRL